MPATSSARRPSLLYVSPVLPTLTGNGLSMRAGAILRALAERYRVTLLVEPIYVGDAWLAEDLRRVCERVAIVQPGCPGGELFAGERFDVVHVFRLAALPTSQPYLARAVRRHLDLDDVESETRRRLAALYRVNGQTERAGYVLAEAGGFALVEDEVLADFDRVYVCSEQDRERLAGRGPAEIRVLPNTLPVQPPLPPPPTGRPFTFLFIGTLGYYPNADGVRWWCADVLPRLRVLTATPFRLAIVGTGANLTVSELGSLPEVDVIGQVPDVGIWYQRADAVIIPIRAGGGTRIKALEAFSFRRPVVTTTVGAEGIEAHSDRELLVADSPTAFAEQCARLMSDADLRVQLTEAAVALLVRSYLPASVSGALVEDAGGVDESAGVTSAQAVYVEQVAAAPVGSRRPQTESR